MPTKAAFIRWARALALVSTIAASRPALAQDIKVDFQSNHPIPVYLVSDLYIRDPQLLHIASSDVVFAKMELLTIAPGSTLLAKGRYQLNIGGAGDFSDSLILDLQGGDKVVSITGNKGLARIFAYATAITSTLLVASIPGFQSDTQAFGPGRMLGAGAAALSLGCAIGWVANLPRARVRDASP